MLFIFRKFKLSIIENCLIWLNPLLAVCFVTPLMVNIRAGLWIRPASSVANVAGRFAAALPDVTNTAGRRCSATNLWLFAAERFRMDFDVTFFVNGSTHGSGTQLMVVIPFTSLKMWPAPSVSRGSVCEKFDAFGVGLAPGRKYWSNLDPITENTFHVLCLLVFLNNLLIVLRISDLDISFPIVARYSLNKTVKCFRYIPKTRLLCAKTKMA